MLSVSLIHTNPEVGTIQSPILKGCKQDLPGGTVEETPPANAWEMGSIHGPEDSTSHRAAQPSSQLLSLCSRAREPQLLSTQAGTTNA